ncbi:MAG TPA: glycosyltransferase family 4 protein [Actinomycetota bacterium]
MRVALSFPGCHRQGGVERVVFECARYLAAREHRVTVFADAWEVDGSASVTYRRVPVRRHPWFLRGRSYFEACQEQLRAASYDVLNTHGCVCPEGGVHWVHSVHKAWLERGRRFRPALSPAGLRHRLNPAHRSLLALEERHLGARNYQRVIALSPHVRDDLGRLYGVPADDVTVIPNGFSPAEFNPGRRARERAEVRRRLGIEPDHVVLLFVANELERKGYATVLAAMRRLGRAELRLLVAGRVSPEQVRKQAREFGVADQVRPLGPSRDVGALHAAGDLLVLPTQYEAFSLSILEALGSGLPVVTSSVPGAGDAIRLGVNGALVDDPTSGEELASVLQPLLDRDAREALSANAPGSVEAYRWPSVLQRYERVLLEHAR